MNTKKLQGERPILFSAPMVRAILAGKKTQTRRVITPQPAQYDTKHGWGLTWKDNKCGGGADWLAKYCPYGAPGDSLWVRETWRPFFTDSAIYLADAGTPRLNAATAEAARKAWPGWKPSIHMPRALSRLSLRVTDVRVERLQSITERDARAEGVVAVDIPADEDGPLRIGFMFGPDDGKTTLDVRPQESFARGWDSINDKRAPWSSNPWVWCVSFERIGATP